MKTFTKLLLALATTPARRITAHRGAADCHGQNSKLAGGVKNTAEVVVTDITTDDRQAGWLGGRAWLAIPLVELPLRTQLLTVNVPVFSIPAEPFLMVRPEIVAIVSTEKTEGPWLPSIESWFAPGPEIVTFLATTSPPLVSLMTPLTAKVILSPSCTTASA